MPGIQHGAQSGAGIARRGLHEHVLPAPAALQGGHQQYVQREPSGQAEVLAVAGHLDDGLLEGLLQSRRHRRPHRPGNLSSVREAEALVELGTEAAAAPSLAVKEGTVDAGPAAVSRREDLEKQVVEAVVSGSRQPLDLVLVGVRFEAQQFRYPPVQVTQRVRIVELLFERQPAAARAPARPAAEIAGPVQRNHGGLLERRGIVRGGGVRRVVLDQHDLAPGKRVAELQVRERLGAAGERPHDGHAVHLPGLDAGHAQAGVDGLRRQFAGLKTPRDFLLLDGGDQLTVLQDRASGIVEQAADSQNDHPFPFRVFSILAQVSRRVTVRLNTSFPGAESGSTQK